MRLLILQEFDGKLRGALRLGAWAAAWGGLLSRTRRSGETRGAAVKERT